ncbi:pseudoazurin [Silicimonas sp. MF1-12-2]|uniref:pseudoazurin n=1 Tax=Silicimonas sp. MF1-12-2 TaxID=3384793 RepID=UPI0039B4CAC7
MKLTRRNSLKLMGATALAASPLQAIAGAHGGAMVEMLNKAPESNERQVFHPPVLQVEPGTTVMFKATDRGHNSEANKDMIPDGVEVWKGKIGEDIEVTFDAPGLYGYHCTPHQSAGMVGLVLVGEVTQDQINAAKEVRHRGKSKARYEEYLAMAEEMIAAN